MENCCSAVPGYKYYEVHCYGDDRFVSECYLITTNESIARGFAMAQMQAIVDDSSDFRFNTVHLDVIETSERMVL